MRHVRDAARWVRLGARAALTVTAACVLLGWTSRARAADVEAILARLEERVAGVNSIETGFVQDRKLALFKKSLVLRGRLYMQQPDRFAWHLEEPIRTRLVLDGSRMRLWDETSGDVQTLGVDQNPMFRLAANQIRQWFSGRYSALRSEYDIDVASETPTVLRFTARDGNAARNFIESVAVTFRDDERYIKAIEIVEKGGDSTSIAFRDTILNGDIPENAWQVEPASGTRTPGVRAENVP